LPPLAAHSEKVAVPVQVARYWYQTSLPIEPQEPTMSPVVAPAVLPRVMPFVMNVAPAHSSFIGGSAFGSMPSRRIWPSVNEMPFDPMTSTNTPCVAIVAPHRAIAAGIGIGRTAEPGAVHTPAISVLM